MLLARFFTENAMVETVFSYLEWNAQKKLSNFGIFQKMAIFELNLQKRLIFIFILFFYIL